MRGSFRGIRAGGYVSELDVIVWGVQETDDVLILLMRGRSEGEIGQLYFEYGAQAAADYGCVEGCRISSTFLNIEFSRCVNGLPGVVGIDVELLLSESEHREAVAWLTEIFAPYSDRLVVAQQSDGADRDG